MRRLGVLLVLFGVMLGVSALKAESSSAQDPMTLAAIGFVLLAAFTLAETGSMLGLPRVTGYILAGTVLGPSVADILSKSVVGEMQMFNTLALGLIATAAGLELDARQIARMWRTLAGTIAVKVVLGIGIVGGTLYLWEATVGSLAISATSSLIALALIFGTLSLGTSPAIALAVTTEIRSKGRLSDLVLGAAVLKDLVVVVALAVSVTVAQSLIGESSAMGSHVIAEVSRELGFSIGVGAALGGLLVLYLRYVRAEMLLFVAAMILVMAEVGSALRLELLLVFITAGFVVRNFSRFEHDLMKPVQMVALPVFVVFFTNAGANIDLLRTGQVLPLALVLGASRALVYYLAGRFGGRLGAESEAVRRGAWLAYLPQAGVTLGLVGLAAAKLPQLADTITTLGMAVVAVNLLVGPITLRLALRRSGEVPIQGQRPSAVPEGALAAGEDEAGADERIEAVVAAVTDRRIAAFARRVADDVSAVSTELIEEQLAPWANALSNDLAQVLDDETPGALDALAGWSASSPSVIASDRSEHVHELFRRVRQQLRHLPEIRALPYLQRHGEASAGDNVPLRFRKSWLRLRHRFGGGAVRPVPITASARVAVEGRLVRAYFEVVRQSNRAEAQVLADLQRVALGHLDRGEASSLIVERLSTLLEHSRRDVTRALALAIKQFIVLLEDAGSPAVPLSSVRYSVTEVEVRRLLTELAQESVHWCQGLSGARNAVHLAATLGGARASTRATLGLSVILPLEASVESSAEMLRGVEGQLRALQQQVDADGAGDALDPAPIQQALQEAFKESVWHHLERDAARFRSGVSTHRVALEVRRAIENLPQYTVVTDARILASEAEPAKIPQVELAAAELWQSTLLKELLPGIDEDVRRSAVAMVSTTQRLREAEEIAVYAIEQLDGEADSGAIVSVRDALGRAASRLQEQATTLTETRASTSEAIHQRVDAAFESLSRTLLEPAKAREKVTRRALLRQLYEGTRRLRELLARWREGLGATVHRVGRSEISKDLLSRYRKSHLDAVSLHEHVVRHTTIEALPVSYAKLFSLEPLVGPRLFAAYRRQLESLVEAERAWLDGKTSSALVVGAHGTGRTSLLNQCKLELSAPRVIRPEPLQWRRDLGLLAALGVSLGVRPSVGSVARALSATKTTILVDDLEQWISPDLSGIAELERVLDLVVRTSDHAFWVVTIESSAFALFQELVPLAHAFGLFVRLEPLTTSELRAAVEERHRISGRTLRYAAAPLSAIRNRFPGLTDQDVSWRVLAGLSDGNLSRALSLWIQSVTLDADEGIEIAVQRLLRAALPFVGWLHPRDQAVLAQLMRFGPLRQSRLAQLLGFGRSDVVRRLAFLRAAGLVEGGRVERDPARIPIQLRPTILQGLRLFQVKS